MYDFIIVGQGLAGSWLAYLLEQAQQKIIIIDEKQGETSSTKATGLINPITGRRFVKSWKIDELIPFAKQSYKALEQKFSSSFFEETKAHRIIQSVEQQNDWASKANDSKYKHYLQNQNLVHYNSSIIKNDLACVEIAPLYKINMPILIEKFTQYFETKKCLLRQKIEYQKLQINTDSVQYENIKAKHIIFCEGFATIHNPYFNYLPFVLSKGEVLTFKAEKLKLNAILGANTHIAPLEKGLFSVGASYAWNDYSPSPTLAKRKELIEKLEAILKCSYTIVEQKAGIRPTVKDRRPLIGTHPQHKNIHIFNGMGTKGLSLAPYFATHFVENLLENKPIETAVNIERFMQ